MTINKGVQSANISTIKAKLTSFLRLVKKGKEVIILDRQTPIAKLIPWNEKTRSGMGVQPPKISFSKFLEIKPSPLSSQVDSLSLLMEDRSKR